MQKENFTKNCWFMKPLSFVAAMLLWVSVSFAGITPTTMTVTPNTNYTPGSTVVFTVTLTYTSTNVEWVDMARVTFPTGITINQAATLPLSGSGFCATNTGIRSFPTANSVQFNSSGYAGLPNGTGCGFWSSGAQVYTISVDIPSTFHGPLTITADFAGDGFGAPAGPASSLSSNMVTLQELVPCVYTCPGPINISLGPGECNSIVNFATPTATSGCNVIVTTTAPQMITQNLNTTLMQDALSCGALPESHYRSYNANTFLFTMNAVRMASWTGGTTQIFVYTYTGTTCGATLNEAQMTLVGQSLPTVVVSGPNNIVPLVAPVVIPPGTAYVVEQRRISANLFVNAGNYGGQTCPSYMKAAPCGIPTPTSYANIGFGFIHLLQVLIGTAVVTISVPPAIVQTSPIVNGVLLTSGDQFPIGCNTVNYNFVNPVTGAIVNTCSFPVCVNEFPVPPGQSLSCIGNVQVSVGDDCTATIGADDLLSGTNGCFDDFIVEVYRNGQLIPGSPVVTYVCGGNNTYTAKVIDPLDPNNACWSNITVEDKIAPSITCIDATVPCGTDLDPFSPANTIPGPVVKSFDATVLAPINDAQTTNTIIPVSLSQCQVTSGLTLQSVDLEFRHTWVGDVSARLVAPNGTSVSLFAQGGCANDNFKVTFQDGVVGTNAALNAQCLACAAPPPACYAKLGTFQAGANMNTTFDLANLANVNGNWRIETFDGVGGDQGQVTVARLNFAYTGIPFCSPDPAAIDNCGPVASLTYSDHVNFVNNCTGPFISQIARTWTATDCTGNIGQCTQLFNIERADLADLVIDDITVDCTSPYPTPDWLVGQGLQGYPTGQGCNVQATYTDVVINVCQNSYKIVRTWTVLDWCTGTIVTIDQLIKVLDQVGPSFNCPLSSQVLIDGYDVNNQYVGCTAHVLIPWVPMSDNCSSNNNIDVVVSTTNPITGVTYSATDPGADGYFEFDLPLGNYTFTYCATDDCGNETCCDVDVQIDDETEPVAICESHHQVSLTDSITWVNASAFDDGSFDDCGPVTFLARRLDNPKCQGNDATPFSAQVPFYCCDAKGGTDVTVELRVIDVDGNFNTCWSTVKVEDKVRPLITCPPDITVWCGVPYTPSNVDTTIIHADINAKISNVYAHTYLFPITVEGFPKGSTIWDLDLHVDITHEYTNDLEVTLINPFGVSGTVLYPNEFPGCYGENINNTFNDQAYDIDYFNATGVKIPACAVCTQTKNPSIGSFNVGTYPNGQTRAFCTGPGALKGFNGYPLNNVNSKLFANVQYNEINVALNRMSNFEIFTLINALGLVPGQTVVLRYDGATSGADITGLEEGQYYIWKVIDAFTLELTPENAADITAVELGSVHKFTFASIWLLKVKDTKVLAGGTVNSIDLHIAWGLPTALRPIATDNAQECGLMLTWSDLDQPDPCYNNVIRRRWVATDMFNNSRNCIQRISFEDETPFVVQFPCDVTITCDNQNNGFNGFDIDEYLAAHQPVHSGDCESVGIESIVHELTVVPDACRKYIVHWKIIDWCTFDINSTVHTDGGIALSYDELIEWFPNLPWHNQCNYFIPGFPFNIRAFEDDGDGYFDQIQYIKLIDITKPVFTNCVDTVICAYGACNETVTLTANATDICTDSVNIKYSFKVDGFNDGTTDVTGTGNTFTGNVPFGKHRITWTATDGCGNYTTCSYIFYVKDCKKPTPVCINGLSAPNMPVQQVVTIWAIDWESGSSFDNCCAFDDLVHRVIKTGESDHQTPPTSTSVTFGCTELGSQPVEVWVGDCGYDENGDGVISDDERNWDFCNTFILITDNNGVCDTTSTMAQVVGGVETENGKMVNGVNMTAVASGYNQQTSTNGQFSFTLPKNQPYTIVPSKDVNPLNGVNTLDLVYITNHILGKKALTSAYKKIAADINKDKNITTGDLVQLRQLILHITNNFPANTSWRFVDKAYTFTTNKEQAEKFPEVVVIPNLTTPKSINFIGVKVGDVDNSANPASAKPANEVRSGGTLTLGVADQDLTAGQEYKVNFTARDFNNMAGYQFTIGYDVNTLDFVGLEGKAADINGENFGLTHLEEGMITTSWNGKSLTTLKSDDVLFTLTFKANKSGKLSKAISVNSNLTPAVAFNGNEEAMVVALQFYTNNGVVSASEL